MKNLVNQLAADLERLGVTTGGVLLVHASLNAIGRFENRAQIVVESLLEALGPSGTLLMPALTFETVTKENPVFNVKHTPSCVGGLAEYFRLLPETKRSIHPTHSVCAVGAHTELLLNDHFLDHTPCGLHSPFRKLPDFNGSILFLGCGLSANTSMHAVEELSEPEYLFADDLEYTIEAPHNDAYKKIYRTHGFTGFEQRYDRIVDILDATDYSFGAVLQADSYLVKAKPLWKKAHDKLVQNPLYFVDKTAPSFNHGI